MVRLEYRLFLNPGCAQESWIERADNSRCLVFNPGRSPSPYRIGARNGTRQNDNRTGRHFLSAIKRLTTIRAVGVPDSSRPAIGRRGWRFGGIRCPAILWSTDATDWIPPNMLRSCYGVFAATAVFVDFSRRRGCFREPLFEGPRTCPKDPEPVYGMTVRATIFPVKRLMSRPR